MDLVGFRVALLVLETLIFTTGWSAYVMADPIIPSTIFSYTACGECQNSQGGVTYAGEFLGNLATGTGAGQSTYSSSDGIGQFSSYASALASPTPNVSASVEWNPNAGFTYGASYLNGGGDIDYYFDVIAQDSTTVQVTIAYTLTNVIPSSDGGSVFTFAGMDVSAIPDWFSLGAYGEQKLYSNVLRDGKCITNGASGDGTACGTGTSSVLESSIFQFMATTNSVYEVRLTAGSGSNTQGVASASASSSISLDPNSAGDTLELSDSVGNDSTSVPEPASMMLLLVGVSVALASRLASAMLFKAVGIMRLGLPPEQSIFGDAEGCQGLIAPFVQ